MPQRTLSIVIEVSGTEEAAQQVRQLGSALDDFTSPDRGGLAQFARGSREATQALKEMQRAFQWQDQLRGLAGNLEDFFRRILSGARTTGDLFKNIWKEIADFFRQTVQPMSASWAGNLGGLLGGLTVGSSNRAVSILGGIGGGALSGLAFGGPLGAAVGAVFGGLAGLFSGGSGKQKRHDADIANQGFAQLAQILEDYNHFRRNYASAVDAAYRIWSQMESQWVRSQSAPSQWPYYAAILQSLGQTEDERNRRRQLASLLPLPEFAAGGFVPAATPSLSRGLLAVVHPGEFVMSRPAVERLGASVLQGLNQGSEPRPLASGLQISLEPASASTLGEMLKRNPQALEEGLLVVLRRGGAVSRALRS